MAETAAKLNPILKPKPIKTNQLSQATQVMDNITRSVQPTTIEPNRFYTRQQIEALGICSWMTLRRAEKAGKLKVYSYGYRLRRYLGSDLLRWMEGKSAKPAKTTTSK